MNSQNSKGHVWLFHTEGTELLRMESTELLRTGSTELLRTEGTESAENIYGVSDAGKTPLGENEFAEFEGACLAYSHGGHGVISHGERLKILDFGFWILDC